MPTLVNNLRAIRGPVTAVPMVGQSGVVVEPDTQNNQVVVRADETVLYSGNLGVSSQATLSESWHNFERIKVFGYSEPGGAMCNEAKVSDMEAAGYDGIAAPDINLSTVSSWLHRSDYDIIVSLPVIFSANTTITTLNGRLMGYWNGSWQIATSESRLHVTKVIGINRIANN